MTPKATPPTSALPARAAKLPALPARKGKPFASFVLPTPSSPSPQAPQVPRPLRPKNESAPAPGGSPTKGNAFDEAAPLAIDPSARVSFQLAPPQHAAPIAKPSEVVDATHAARAAETHALATSLVERASFWGDGARGVARLHFGTRAKGGLAGATVMLESVEGEVSMKVSGAADADAIERLAARLRAKGIEVDHD